MYANCVRKEKLCSFRCLLKIQMKTCYLHQKQTLFTQTLIEFHQNFLLAVICISRYILFNKLFSKTFTDGKRIKTHLSQMSVRVAQWLAQCPATIGSCVWVLAGLCVVKGELFHSESRSCCSHKLQLLRPIKLGGLILCSNKQRNCM